jgi:hypothetical protein
MNVHTRVFGHRFHVGNGARTKLLRRLMSTLVINNPAPEVEESRLQPIE